MNKKNLSIIVLISILVIVIIFTCFNNKKEIIAFSIDDYQEKIENYNDIYEKKNRTVNSYDEALKVGQEVLIEVYGKSVLKQKPFLVYYDEETDYWMITGSNKRKSVGGVAYIIFDSNCNVKAVWHDK